MTECALLDLNKIDCETTNPLDLVRFIEVTEFYYSIYYLGLKINLDQKALLLV